MVNSIQSSNPQQFHGPEVISSQQPNTIQSLHMLNHPLPIKLDRNNYVLWKTQMENVIYANGFEEHIEGLKPCPPQMIAIALEKIFSASSKARIMQLRLAFQTTRKGSLPIMEYVLKMKTITNSLAAIGEPMAERDQILQLLAGLEADYNPIVASLTAREDDLTLHSVHSILLSHEQRLHFQNSIVEDEVISAHITTQDHPQPSKKYHTGKPGSSFNSQNSFHHQQNRRRPNAHGQNQRTHQSGGRPQCQLCGKYGHTIISCYHRFDINFQGPDILPTNPTKASSNVPVNTNKMQAMVVSPSSAFNDSWFLDSGATHHLSHNEGQLSNIQPYQGKHQVTVGNSKQLPISSIGSKYFHSSLKSFQLQDVFHVPQLTTNLISVSKFCTDNNSFFEFHPNIYLIKDKTTK
ncbi:Retrovirus-related Pol polyprotein from transposon RE1 [Vitis vinifera]|uniref:Retrovirus-related Pol polyprotein from transposon RE1 n=1 Tax=Vitis vinifera TaxID=29760 RepID=A0A438GVN9_VITVI|nr:Retrovirus-related Pol polyprotein from transposon RE1 [Vitis vinifera]